MKWKAYESSPKVKRLNCFEKMIEIIHPEIPVNIRSFFMMAIVSCLFSEAVSIFSADSSFTPLTFNPKPTILPIKAMVELIRPKIPMPWGPKNNAMIFDLNMLIRILKTWTPAKSEVPFKAFE